MIKIISGYATMFFGISMVLFGLTAQVIKNRKEKQCGNPLVLALLAMMVYISRATRAITIGDLFILIPDVIGVILSLVMIGQFIKYRKK